MKVTRKRFIFLFLVLVVAALSALTLRPKPIKVDVARAGRGQLRVTIDEEGETRAHDRFVVAAPVAGRLERIELRDGDRVARDQVVAIIHPLPLDPRERDVATARVQTAEAFKREADARIEHARAIYEQARRDRERMERLAEKGVVDVQSLERAKSAEITSVKELEAARFNAQAAASEVEVAKAALIALESQQSNPTNLVELRSPVHGQVLRVIEKSERIVVSGSPLLEIADASKLEIVIDVLSVDAVKVRVGAPILLEDWGGDRPLRARVRVVEPSGFTKISALGVEEQRVNIIADFVDPPERLGTGYRVEARIVVWEAENVLKVPLSALFRHGQGWSVFVIEGGTARRRDVEVGHRSAFEVEILSGIEEGATVILHPTGQIEDGVRVQAR